MFLYAFFLRKEHINIVYTFIFLLFIKLPCVCVLQPQRLHVFSFVFTPSFVSFHILYAYAFIVNIYSLIFLFFMFPVMCRSNFNSHITRTNFNQIFSLCKSIITLYAFQPSYKFFFCYFFQFISILFIFALTFK